MYNIKVIINAYTGYQYQISNSIKLASLVFVLRGVTRFAGFLRRLAWYRKFPIPCEV